ncbi:MAG: TRAP transporter large permease subunit, partial [Pararhodobacter sp.]|nr:TRAP transporter large permease subunit [Pararhodobacter sp.]
MLEWYYVIAIIVGPLLVLMLMGLPVAFSFIAVNIVGAYLLLGGVSGVRQVVMNTIDALTSFTLVPVALFMIMGEGMFQSRIAIDLMDTLDKWFGKLRGRLAFMAVGGGVLFSSLTGNSMGAIALLGSSLVPEMEKRGYKKPMSLGPILGSSGLAIMIPPSSLAVVLGVVAELSIGRILIGIIVPGLLMALLYVLYIYIRVTI